MIYFFYGEEDFNIDLEVEKLKKELDPNFLEMSYKTYDHPKFPDLISILRSQPMMFGKMLIVIECVKYFSEAFEDKEIKQITEALEDNNENLDIVFTAKLPRDEGKKLDSRRKLFKLLVKQKSKEFPTIPTYKPELASWINNQAKIYKLKLTPDAVSTLISMVGNNLRQLDSEIQKLAISVYPKDTAGDKDVREICTNNEDLFALSDALMQMDYETALLEYKKLLDKDHPIKILATLQTMTRRWVTLKANAKASPFELLKLTGMNEYVIKLTLQKMKNTTLHDLVTLKKNLTTCEYRIKSGQALDVEREVANAFFVR